jgi:predicted aldo/keto reductase-like oxidoreductase
MRLPQVVDEKTKMPTAQVDLDKAIEIIQYAADNGINYFDTAYGYHSKMSESVLGEALSYGGRRKRVKIATKQPLGAMGGKRENIRKNLESALTKLRTDYIDVYLMHAVDGNTWDSFKALGAIEEWQKFREEGLIKSIAFSFHGNYTDFARVFSDFDWDMCQVQHNMLDLENEATLEGVQLAGKKGCAVVIMEPLRGGGLAHAPERVKELYNSYDSERLPVEWAFKYLLDKPEISTILSGMSTLEQLKQNIEIFSKPQNTVNSLTEQEKKILSEAKARYESFVTVPCTGCEYCLPCPKKVAIPNIFRKYNDGMMFGAFGQAKREYWFNVASGSDAEKCVECGACESKCPQKIKIIESLKTAHESLKGHIE